MKRREALPLVPLSVAGLSALAVKAFSQSMPSDDHVVHYSFSSPEPLSLLYTQKVRQMLTWIRNTQSDNILEAAYMTARTKMKGGSCWCMWDMGHGHNIDIRDPGRNGLPEIFTDGYDPKKAKDGDLFLANINLSPIVNDLDKKDIFVIGSPVPWGMDAVGGELIGAELGAIRKIARMAVDSVLSGGRVYGYDRYGGFAAEARGRRGGLLLTQGMSADEKGNISGWNSWAGEEQPSPKDLVIMGLSKPDDEVDLRVLDAVRAVGAKAVSMGPMTRDNKIPDGRTVPKETDVHVGLMCDTCGLFAVSGFNRKVCPTSGALLNQIFWATCMEIVCEIYNRTGGDVPNAFLSAALKGGLKNMYRLFEVYKQRGY